MAGGTLKHAKEMIGHKPLRMADRYSHLESARENIIQDNVAAHYEDPKAMASKKRNTERTYSQNRSTDTKKGFQVYT